MKNNSNITDIIAKAIESSTWQKPYDKAIEIKVALESAGWSFRRISKSKQPKTLCQVFND